MTGIRTTLSDIGLMPRRNMLKYVCLPHILIFNAMLNVVLLLFNYVFDGSSRTADRPTYSTSFSGVFVQTILFGSTRTSVGIAEDLSKGTIDRFRALPLARSFFLSGRVVADTARYGLLTLLMIALGVIIGFRFSSGIGPAVAAFSRSLHHRWSVRLCKRRIRAMPRTPCLYTMPKAISFCAGVWRIAGLSQTPEFKHGL